MAEKGDIWGKTWERADGEGLGGSRDDVMDLSRVILWRFVEWFVVGMELMAGFRLIVEIEGEMLAEMMGEMDIGEFDSGGGEEVANLPSRGGLR